MCKSILYNMKAKSKKQKQIKISERSTTERQQREGVVVCKREINNSTNNNNNINGIQISFSISRKTGYKRK